MKKIFLAVLTVLMLFCFASCNKVSDDKNVGTAHLYIHCETVVDNGGLSDDYENIPVVFDDDVTIGAGDTAYDVISSVLRKSGIHLEFENSVYGKYITGIANVYAGDFGETSGWLFKINGEFADKSCSEYEVHDGDEIEFVYTCVMGDVE